MIATVSATMSEETLTRFPQIHAQLAWADTVVITHTDVANKKQIDTLHTTLTQIAPSATQINAVHGAVLPSLLLAFPQKNRYVPENHQVDLTAHRFKSISLQLEHPMAWQRLETVLTALLIKYRHQLVRLKGVIYTLEHTKPLVVQGAGGYLYPPHSVPVRPSDDNIGRLVFITDGDISHLTQELMVQLRT